MKYHLLFILVLCASLTRAQTSTELADAKRKLNQNSIHYNPAKAFEIYQGLARQGNPEALNALGILSGKGIGTSQDQNKSLYYFKEAAQKGYGNAWYNLGIMYKNGLGTAQDLRSAYECFDKGAALNSSMAIYSKGYMLFKGLGCSQNYTEAVQQLKKASQMANLGAMYFLGLCYRNGYGISANPDSAKFWLRVAHSFGEQQATQELLSKEPENISLVSATNLSSTANELPKFKKNSIKNQNDLNGSYSGYIIRYDWSGKYIISKSSLKLQLKSNAKHLSGVWMEEDSIQTPFQASVNDSIILFNNTVYNRKNHYSKQSAEVLEFKSAKLNLTQSQDSTFLTGNVSFFSTARNEPGKPTYITLTKDLDKKTSSAKSAASANKLEADVFTETLATANENKLLVYPNPFSNGLHVDFHLASSMKVTFSLLNTEGKVFHQENDLMFPEGSNTYILKTDLKPGVYILRVVMGREVKTTVVIKQ